MSSYTKPHTYANGTSLDADSHTSNEESARIYVNDNIISSDVTSNTLDTTDLGAPRYIAPVAEWQGFSKTIGGNVDLQAVTNRAYFSSTAKTQRQEVKGVRNYQAIPNASYEVHVDRSNAYFWIRGYANATALENLTGFAGIRPGQYLADNLIALEIEDIDAGTSAISDQTGDFVFGPSGAYNATRSDYDPGAGGSSAQHRTVSFSYYGLINGKGRKRFSLVVDPKVERGFITVKSFVFEVFYI